MTRIIHRIGMHVTMHNAAPELEKALIQRTEPDMDAVACSEILDCMEAYYKVPFPLHSRPQLTLLNAQYS